MKLGYRKRLAVVLLVIAMTAISVMPIFADGAPPLAVTEEVAEQPSLGSVAITPHSSIEIKQAFILAGNEGKTVSFTLTLHNEDENELQFIDYWVRLATKSGTSFTVNIQPQDKEKNRVAAHSSIDVNMYAKVNESTELNDLIFKIIHWDFSGANYENNVGEIPVPDDYNVATPAGSARIVNVGGTKVKMAIGKVSLSRNDAYYLPRIQFKLEDVGLKTIDLPTYQFFIRTKEGLVYPVQVSGIDDKNRTIYPRITKELYFSGSLPQSVGSEGWELIIASQIDLGNDGKLNIPVAYFVIPSPAASAADEQEYPFTTKSGVYLAKLENIQRLPWEDKDIVTASLSITNKGSDSQPVPALTGYYLLDGTVRVPFKAIFKDSIVSLKSNSTLRVLLYGSVPYTNDYSKIKLVLQEKESDTVTNDLLEFTSDAKTASIPVVNLGESYRVDDVGRASGLSIHDVRTYESLDSDLFTVQLDVQNLEKRMSSASGLVAYFKNQDDMLYPAAISEIKNKVGPQATATLSVSTLLSKHVNRDGMSLIVGWGVKDDKLVAKEPEAYIDAAVFKLPQEEKEPKNDLNNINLFPYTVSMNHFNAQIAGIKPGGEVEINLRFKYSLAKNMMVESMTTEHQLQLEFKDPLDNYSKTINIQLDKDEADNVLVLGEHNKELTINEDSPYFRISSLKNYQINIYDTLNGYKKLLATRNFVWNETSD